MKTNTLHEQNAAQITFSLILEGERRMKEQSGTEEYWSTQEALKSELNLFIRIPGNLADLTNLELLEVCRMVGSYRPMALHTFFIYCEKALEGITQ